MVPQGPTWNSEYYLRTNYLSSYWKPAYRPHGCASISLVPLYIVGMVSFALSIIPRIIGLVKEIFNFALVLTATLLTCCFTRNALKEQGKKLLSSIAEVFTAVIGTLCPPLAVYLEEKLQSSQEACARTFPWNKDVSNWVYARVSNPNYTEQNVPIAPPAVAPPAAAAPPPVGPRRDDPKPPSSKPSKPSAQANPRAEDSAWNQKKVDELLKVKADNLMKPKEQTLAEIVEATKTAKDVLTAQNNDFDLTLHEDMEKGLSLAIAILLYDNKALNLSGILDPLDLENFNSYQSKVAPFIPGYRTDIRGDKSPEALRNEYIDMIVLLLYDPKTAKEFPFSVPLKEAGKRLTLTPFAAEILKEVLRKKQ